MIDAFVLRLALAVFARDRAHGHRKIEAGLGMAAISPEAGSVTISDDIVRRARSK